MQSCLELWPPVPASLPRGCCSLLHQDGHLGLGAKPAALPVTCTCTPTCLLVWSPPERPYTRDVGCRGCLGYPDSPQMVGQGTPGPAPSPGSFLGPTAWHSTASPTGSPHMPRRQPAHLLSSAALQPRPSELPRHGHCPSSQSCGRPASLLPDCRRALHKGPFRMAVIHLRTLARSWEESNF